MSAPVTIKVDPKPDHRRLDLYLARQGLGFSRSVLQRMIRQGWISIRETPDSAPKIITSIGFRLSGGEEIILQHQTPPNVEQPRAAAPTVLYEDSGLLAVNKPAGLLVHPTSSLAFDLPHQTAQNLDLFKRPSVLGWLRKKYPDTMTVPRNGMVHRLDAGTSGILLIAKTAPAYWHLHKLFAKRQIEKLYAAVVEGEPRFKEFAVDQPLLKSYHNKRVSMKAGGAGGKEAQTLVKVIKTYGWASLLEVRPITGRTHQIRLHLTSIGHPVLGDPIYGIRRKKEEKSLPVFSRLMLHARQLRLAWPPGTGETLTVKAPLPADFKAEYKRYLKESPPLF
ncbi:MAG: RluA family pseudouridine synthase [Elusimicrobia bacterium]|nr:RluA family pseudouridine synthase [Elusimicrobiota bacterium]